MDNPNSVSIAIGERCDKCSHCLRDPDNGMVCGKRLALVKPGDGCSAFDEDREGDYILVAAVAFFIAVIVTPFVVAALL